MNIKQFATPIVAAAVAAGLGSGVAVIASAQTTSPTSTVAPAQKGMGMFGNHKPGVVGTVASISGNSLTVTGKNGTTYTVDGSNAKIMKAPARPTDGTKPTTRPTPTTISLNEIKVGDTVMVEGTVSGNSVVATSIMNGAMGRGGMGGHGRGSGPGVMGTIASITGTTMSVTGKDGTTYTVDMSAAKLNKTTTITVADLKVGDSVGVMGTVSGTKVTAQHVMDGIPPMGGPGQN